MFNALKNARIKYKFWLLNIVVLAVLLLLVLYAVDQIAAATGQRFSDVLVDRAPAFAGVVCVLMLLEMVASQFLITFIERHVHRLKHTMVEVQKTGNLSQRAVVDSRDEIGEMAIAFNAMQTRTIGVVRSMKDAIDRLQLEVQELSVAAEQSRDELRRQQRVTEDSAQVVQTMLGSFVGIAERAEDARLLSHEARDAALKGDKRVAQTSDSIGRLAGAIAESAASVQALADNSQEISTAVAEIQGIAEQTNLLALNAAIEAARAGEQGRGFAVVADEVRNLAQRVQDSTRQIQDTINRLLGTVENAVSQMHTSSEDARRCVEDANQAKHALDDISAVVTRIDDTNQAIADLSASQTAHTDEVQDNLQSIRDTTQSMVQQLVASAEMGTRLRGLIKELEAASAQVQVEEK